MKITACNRCKRPIGGKYFDFDIKCYSAWGALISDTSYVNDVELQLNDFCLCEDCMKDFVNFVKEGNK